MVDKNEALKNLVHLNRGDMRNSDEFFSVLEYINASEPAVHAKWKFIDGDEYTEDYKCSNCGCEITIDIELNRDEKPRYCKDCGARMDGEGCE